MTEQTMPTVLIVEDEALIAMDLQDLLVEAGYRVVGSVNSVERALAILAQEKPNLALLDINLGRSTSFDLADALAELGTKMLFFSGHSRGVIAEAHKHRPVIAKPFLPDTLLAAMDALRKEAIKRAE